MMNWKLKTNDVSSWYSAALDEYLSLHPDLELWELADPERLVIVSNTKFNFTIYTERTRKPWNNRRFCFFFYLRNIVQLLHQSWKLNPHYLIWLSNGHTCDFLLKPFFLGYSREKLKTGFSKLESYLKWHAKFQIIGFINATLIGWILYTFQYKIRLVSILRKREDQALISISTILKVSAQNISRNF